ncbi:MAG TPA: flagellar hook capping FlgD N-terminal domain-containing protein [Candidatus Aquicultor sp.]|jgi:flagellar basal-body rod modification protein FlgD
MATDAVTGTTNTSSTQKTRTTTNEGQVKLGDNTGKDSFLELLVTQMRYQDPLSPAKDTEYIAQLAQFNTLEQMQNLNTTMETVFKRMQMSEASNLIGWHVEANIPTGEDTNNDGTIDTATVNGLATEVKFVDGEPKLIVDGKEISLSDITRVYAATAAANSNKPDTSTATDNTTS